MQQALPTQKHANSPNSFEISSPRNWQTEYLGNVVQVLDTQRKPLNESARQNIRGIYPYCGANGILDHINDYLFDGEYVLLAEDGGYWGPFEGSAYLMSGKFWVNNHAHILRAQSDILDNHFLAYQLNYVNIDKFISGTTRGKLTQGVMCKIPISFPSFPEQRSIAHVLQTVQQAIQTRRKELELELERKAALMQYLFTYGTKNKPTKQSEVGEIPESWEVLRLGDICKISTGTTPDTNNLSYYQGDIMFVKTSEIANNRIRQVETSISKDAVKKYNLNIYPPGTVFIAMYGQGKTRGQVALLDIPATTSQNTGAIVPKENLQADFLWQLLMSQYDKLRNAGSQGHISHLNLGYVKQYQIPIPPLEEQIELTNIFYRCDAKIMALKKEIALHEELFRALLEELMTGRISTLPLIEHLEKGTLTHGQRTPDGTGTTH